MVQENRYEAGFKAIKESERRLARLLSPKVINSRLHKEELLRDYDSLLKTRPGDLNPEERKYRRYAIAERKELLKELYPSRFVRVLRSIAKLFIVAPVRAGIQYVKSFQARRNIDEFLKKAGLDHLSPVAELKIKQGANNFILNSTQFVGEGRFVHHAISFEKSNSGVFQPSQHIVALSDQEKVGQTVKLAIPLDAVIDAAKLANLLAGRAVYNKLENGFQKESWLQIDFNDKDSQGNHKVKEFKGNYDLESALNNINSRGLRNPLFQDKFLQQLQNGDRIQFESSLNGKKQQMFAQAAPGKQGIEVMDSSGKNVDLLQIGKPKKVVAVNANELKEEPQARRANLKVHL